MATVTPGARGICGALTSDGKSILGGSIAGKKTKAEAALLHWFAESCLGGALICAYICRGGWNWMSFKVHTMVL